MAGKSPQSAWLHVGSESLLGSRDRWTCTGHLRPSESKGFEKRHSVNRSSNNEPNHLINFSCWIFTELDQMVLFSWGRAHRADGIAMLQACWSQITDMNWKFLALIVPSIVEGLSQGLHLVWSKVRGAWKYKHAQLSCYTLEMGFSCSYLSFGAYELWRKSSMSMFVLWESI
jgi:hypothetical protein